MLFIAIIPWFAWLLLALGLWGVLAWQTYGRVGLRGGLVVGWLGLLALQTLGAIVSAVATRLDAIDRFTCYWGIWGWLVQLALSVMALAGLIGLLKRWPRKPDGRRERVGATFALWAAFSALVVFAHIRSAVLCTV